VPVPLGEAIEIDTLTHGEARDGWP
jgi:hypothetical protein